MFTLIEAQINNTSSKWKSTHGNLDGNSRSNPSESRKVKNNFLQVKISTWTLTCNCTWFYFVHIDFYVGLHFGFHDDFYVDLQVYFHDDFHGNVHVNFYIDFLVDIFTWIKLFFLYFTLISTWIPNILNQVLKCSTARNFKDIREIYPQELPDDIWS